MILTVKKQLDNYSVGELSGMEVQKMTSPDERLMVWKNDTDGKNNYHVLSLEKFHEHFEVQYDSLGPERARKIKRYLYP